MTMRDAGADKRNSTICRGCGAAIRADARFCTVCGLAVPPAPPTPVAACARCGSAGKPDDLFCTTCGAPLAPAPAMPTAPAPIVAMSPTLSVPSGPAILPSRPGTDQEDSAGSVGVPPVPMAPALPHNAPAPLPDRARALLPAAPAPTALAPRAAANIGGPASSAAPVHAYRPRRRRLGTGRRVTLAAGAAVLALILGIGGVFAAPWVFASGFHSAAFLPSDTYLYATVTLRPGLFQLKDAASIVYDFTSQPGFAAALCATGSDATNGGDVNVQGDILPLLDGEVSFAAYGPVTAPHAALLVHSNNPDKLLSLLTQTLRMVPAQSYRGATIESGGSANGIAGVTGAAFRGWVALSLGTAGSGVTDAESIVDRIAGGSADSLASSDRYRQVVDRLPDSKLGFVYADSGASLPALLSGVSSVMLPETRRYLELLSGRAAVAFSAASDGVRLSWESIPDNLPPAPSYAAPEDTRAAFRLLPSDTLAAVSVPDAAALASSFNDAINTAINSAFYGLNLVHVDTGFGAWLGGALALGIDRGSLQAGSAYGGTSGSPDIALVTKVRDTTAAQNTISSFDPFINPRQESYSGYTLCEAPGAPAAYQTGAADAAYGLVDNHFYAVYGQVNHVLDARNNGGLESNPRYQAVQGDLSARSLAVFVDLEGIRQLAENLTPPAARASYDLKVQPFLAPLRALAGGLRTDADGSAHGALVLTVGK